MHHMDESCGSEIDQIMATNDDWFILMWFLEELIFQTYAKLIGIW